MKFTSCLLVLLLAQPCLAANFTLEMKPVTAVVRPRLAAVVEVAAVNETDGTVEVPDLYDDPFQCHWSWSWRWNEGRGFQAIGLDELFDAVPEPLPPRLVRLAPGERVTWFVVLPAPEQLPSGDSATLRGVCTSADRKGAEATCTFKLGRPFVPPERELRPDWFQIMLPTGTETNALDWLNAQKPYLQRWSSEKDASLLLGWFCINLARNQFDERAWSLLQSEAADLRAIRNARLESALRTHQPFLLKNVAHSLRKDLQGDDSLTKSLRKQLEAVK